MTCRICGNAKENTLYEAREMMLGLRERFNYFQCSVCQCLQIDKIPDDLARFYPNDYNGYDPPRSGYYRGLGGLFRKISSEATLFPSGLISDTIKTVFPRTRYQILSRFGIHKNSKILDVGCGRGNFLYPLYELGMTNVQGIEPFIPDTLRYPNGFTIRKGFAKDAVGQWDIVIFNHSFEHVPDPLPNLQAVQKLLKPDGVAIIRIPTVSSFAWEHYREDWFQLDAPRHLFLHSVESVRMLAQQAGLTLSEVIYDSTHMQFLISELYQRDIPLVDRRKATKGIGKYLRYKASRWKYARRARRLNKENKGDQASFILRPRAWKLPADTAGFRAGGCPAG